MALGEEEDKGQVALGEEEDKGIVALGEEEDKGQVALGEEEDKGQVALGEEEDKGQVPLGEEEDKGQVALGEEEDKGQVALGEEEDKGQVALGEEEDKGQVALGEEEDKGQVALGEEEDKGQVALGEEEDKGQVALGEEEDKGQVALGEEEDKGQVALGEEEDKGIVALGEEEDKGQVALGEKDKDIVALGEEEDKGQVALGEEEDKGQVALGEEEDKGQVALGEEDTVPEGQHKDCVDPGYNKSWGRDLSWIMFVFSLGLVHICEAVSLLPPGQILPGKCFKLMESRGNECPPMDGLHPELYKEMNDTCCSGFPGMDFHCQMDYFENENKDQYSMIGCMPTVIVPSRFSGRISGYRTKTPFFSVVNDSDSDHREPSLRLSWSVRHPYHFSALKSQCNGDGQEVFCLGTHGDDNVCTCEEGFKPSCNATFGDSSPCWCERMTCPRGQVPSRSSVERDRVCRELSGEGLDPLFTCHPLTASTGSPTLTASEGGASLSYVLIILIVLLPIVAVFGVTVWVFKQTAG